MAGELSIKVAYLDGENVREVEVKGSHRTYMCLADRVRFERRFNASVESYVQRVTSMTDDEGALRSDASLEGLREEHTMFFIWCELRRRAGDTPSDYDAFLESVADVELDFGTASPPQAAQPAA